MDVQCRTYIISFFNLCTMELHFVFGERLVTSTSKLDRQNEHLLNSHGTVQNVVKFKIVLTRVTRHFQRI